MQKMRLLAIICALLLAAGCKTTTHTSEDNLPHQILTNDEMVPTDPCAARLHDIAGTLLLYIAVNQQMPAKLSDIASVADVDTPLEFDCPVSHQPYGYSAVGLSAPGVDKRIVVYDPTPAHNGQRWCIFMANSHPGGTQSVEVLEVPEAYFRVYQEATK